MSGNGIGGGGKMVLHPKGTGKIEASLELLTPENVLLKGTQHNPGEYTLMAEVTK